MEEKPRADDEPLMTVKDVARLLNVGERWVYDSMNKAEGIPHFKVGHYVRFRRTDILDWLERQRRGG